MQNQIIKHILQDNTIDSFVLINPTKQQIFFIPKEESQMFTSRSQYFTGNRPAGYSNDPVNESENRDPLVALNYINASWSETDYIGMSVYDVPYLIDQDFTDIKVYDVANATWMPITFSSSFTLVDIGNQLFKINKDILNTTLTDAQEIANNDGDTVKKNFGLYLFKISPKFVKSTVTNIIDKRHYPYDKKSDNYSPISESDIGVTPNFKRRNIVHCSKDDFIGTPWNFEANQRQSGRLLGSVVEIWDSSETELKQIKVIAESNVFGIPTPNDPDLLVGDNYYGLNQCSLVFHPDNFGYDSPNQDLSVGDVLRIYPRETYFNNINIQLEYKDDRTSLENAFLFLMNDAVRDIKTGIYEVYDTDGVKVDPNGNFDGKVIQKYQVQQVGQYEIRKKIKNS